MQDAAGGGGEGKRTRAAGAARSAHPPRPRPRPPPRKENPLLRPGRARSVSYMYMPGATAVGMVYGEGIVLASEKRIAYGNFLVSKNTKKTFRITPRVGAACAGLVADMQILSLQISALAKIRRMDLKRDIPPNSIAKMMSNMMYERRFFPLLTQVIVGGVVGKPAVYTLDPLGSVLPDAYAAVGTGAETALGVLDPHFDGGDGSSMKKDDAVALAVKAVRAATLRDSFSGDGIDVLVIDGDGATESTAGPARAPAAA